MRYYKPRRFTPGIRKPHAGNLGYVCELKNRRTGEGHVVIYDKQAGFDADAESRWVIVCETHGTLTSAPSMPKARAIMKAVDFCEYCMGVGQKHYKPNEPN
jgi:hypothetical protein